jgi:hypothetical protein
VRPVTSFWLDEASVAGLAKFDWCTVQISTRESRRMFIRCCILHDHQYVVCAAGQNQRFQRAKAKLLVARISQQRRNIAEQANQKITVMAGAQCSFFGSILVPRHQCRDNSPPRLDGIVDVG